MAKWTIVSFIRAFMHGTLGKKRVHGEYKVLEGDHCKILVKTNTGYGKPTGNSLIGIALDSEEMNISFFHKYNTSCFTYKMNKDLDTYNTPRLPDDVLNGDDSNLLASGIIDANDTEVLIEIGDKPYLLHKKLKDDGSGLKWNGIIPKFTALEKIPSRVASISAAKRQQQRLDGRYKLNTRTNKVKLG